LSKKKIGKKPLLRDSKSTIEEHTHIIAHRILWYYNDVKCLWARIYIRKMYYTLWWANRIIISYGKIYYNMLHGIHDNIDVFARCSIYLWRSGDVIDAFSATTSYIINTVNVKDTFKMYLSSIIVFNLI